MLRRTPRVPATPEHELDGRWINEQGSVLELEVRGDGWITGTFRAASDGTSYRPYRVNGTYTVRHDGGRGVVGSVAGWPRTNSITVWTGVYDPSTDQLRTSWLMMASAGGGPGSGAAGEPGPSVGGETFRRAARAGSMARAG